ncbi:MAG: deoxyribose-phosphate aldolase [Bacteroidia bacterium]|nr:deoxyribose-phosphate aldolase [Bacteroidia bacterium]MBT8275459.1 deoxyribose-phosphate aldolase [Bacteroidia bacterium]NNF30834.1 deoxyribose-phosphate aldolase [Flavobacteriaceae bacterium]NNK54447.1 deoxyribose-phosphate aldolase [Flavobacteriaceae bacterium]NNM08081.1 deoxyribose-phosphate aldolase [Flavobacteriaceae bacterium]
MKPLNRYIDHTLLHPAASPEAIVALCDEAKAYNFYAVCVNSCYVYLAAKELKKSGIRIASTVGFPLGAASTKSKVAEARKAVKDGADEIDMVLNIGFLKSELHKNVKEDIEAVKKEIGKKTLKVILETCYLTDEEKKIACLIAEKAGADYVKTSTGFGTGGASKEDVTLMKATIGESMKIKAAGGISSASEAIDYIELGVMRIGTSNGIRLMEGINTTE